MAEGTGPCPAATALALGSPFSLLPTTALVVVVLVLEVVVVVGRSVLSSHLRLLGCCASVAVEEETREAGPKAEEGAAGLVALETRHLSRRALSGSVLGGLVWEVGNGARGRR